MKNIIIMTLFLSACNFHFDRGARCVNNKPENARSLDFWFTTDDCNLYTKKHICKVYYPENPYRTFAGCEEVE